ncbi:hypothetical protein [Carboxydothermus hydrogenoformans]|uniref:Conserved domain protein n=1 Tax=Carboxydothermus hydrogenoformans (strain ATCC BAA-161 / DSM 6008 / Z-2901) TaxID=246194 RepID=Q3A988_CARHZ|nr:hypothetical protein [Carboxydothermus hydrogenoformans]ABB16190.1 conserved domain protein [Carboxydothermus hydrogenoformans Z-2901]
MYSIKKVTEKSTKNPRKWFGFLNEEKQFNKQKWSRRRIFINKRIKAGRISGISERDISAYFETRNLEKLASLRKYTRQEIRDFLDADKLTPEIARKIKRLLNE